MDKRFFLALLLTAIVIIAPPLLFQRGGVRRAISSIDSTKTPRVDGATNQTVPGGAAPAAAVAPSARVSEVPAQSTPPGATPVETTTVETRLAHYRFSSRGAVPVSVVLDSYPSRRPGAANSASQ